MRSTKSADLIGHDKFLSWRQLDGCSVTRPFLSPAKGGACETSGKCVSHSSIERSVFLFTAAVSLAAEENSNSHQERYSS